MRTIRFGLFWQSLVLLMLLIAPGLSLAASSDETLCEGLSPEMELACLRIYLNDISDPDAEGYEINNSLSGTWYDPERDGEGFMIDVANHGVVVVSYYTFDKTGRQLWLIGTGNVDVSVVEIDLYIADGGIYGPDFNPALVNTHLWGTGTFTFTECSLGFVEIVPNDDYNDQFEPLDMEITRLTVPVNCGPN